MTDASEIGSVIKKLMKVQEQHNALLREEIEEHRAEARQIEIEKELKMKNLKKLQELTATEANGIKSLIENTAQAVRDTMEDVEIPNPAKPVRIRKIIEAAQARRDASIQKIRESAKAVRETASQAVRVPGLHDKPGVIIAAEQDVRNHKPEQLAALYERHAGDQVMQAHIRRLAGPILAGRDVPLQARAAFQDAVRKHRSEAEINRDAAHAGANSIDAELDALTHFSNTALNDAQSGMFNSERSLEAARNIILNRSQAAADAEQN
ncbi:MAG: hypothetical protein M1539_06035 [Actinobacteria bacterium]|nr:hypothetical protein [Actinomycetota bacterium]